MIWHAFDNDKLGLHKWYIGKVRFLTPRCLRCRRKEGSADGKLQGPLRQKDHIGSETARECNTLNGGTKLRSDSVMDFAREGLVRGALGT